MAAESPLVKQIVDDASFPVVSGVIADGSHLYHVAVAPLLAGAGANGNVQVIARFSKPGGYAQIVAKACGGKVVADCPLINSAALQLPGIKLKTSASDGFPIQSVQVQRFDGQNWKVLGGLFNSTEQ